MGGICRFCRYIFGSIADCFGGFFTIPLAFFLHSWYILSIETALARDCVRGSLRGMKGWRPFPRIDVFGICFLLGVGGGLDGLCNRFTSEGRLAAVVNGL
ncbi:MAG TPA: hypothetical protein DEQ20_00555 [Desulfobulbaceae bacterium]|nr:hypothetical protein [Desulfobulbaceae bacterium]